MTYDPVPTNTQAPDSTLDQLMLNLRKQRGDHREWLVYESQLLRFMAAVTPSHRILCRGEIRTGEYQRPAVLMYDVEQAKVEAWGSNKDNGPIMIHDVVHFYSAIPFSSIAHEVLFEKSETKTI